MVLGVTGPPACGKSTVAGMLADLGAATADADRLAHEALERPGVARAVERSLGARLRRPDGSVDRAAVAVLFEGGVDRMCDLTVLVDAPREVRLRRARGRGWSERELRAREARQWPAARRRRLADVVVDNGGSRSATREQVRSLWARAVGATGDPGAEGGPRLRPERRRRR